MKKLRGRLGQERNNGDSRRRIKNHISVLTYQCSYLLTSKTTFLCFFRVKATFLFTDSTLEKSKLEISIYRKRLSSFCCVKVSHTKVNTLARASSSDKPVGYILSAGC